LKELVELEKDVAVEIQLFFVEISLSCTISTHLSPVLEEILPERP
jgi:hypothetical protein